MLETIQKLFFQSITRNFFQNKLNTKLKFFKEILLKITNHFSNLLKLSTKIIYYVMQIKFFFFFQKTIIINNLIN